MQVCHSSFTQDGHKTLMTGWAGSAQLRICRLQPLPSWQAWLHLLVLGLQKIVGVPKDEWTWT